MGTNKEQTQGSLLVPRNMLRSSHAHDAPKVKAPHPAAAHGLAPRAAARARLAACAALGA